MAFNVERMSLLFAEMEKPEAPAYRVLARKYRPTNFQELIGQEALVRTLTNAIESGRLAQAWMLTGVRGIGKTTTARIIARALNCVGADGKSGPTSKPCGVCPNCEAIAADRHVDVLEMDAASRTGVDDIREIVEGVRYGPVSARYKIYIIDEVHMLSKNAFNALLKTLEEPPPHSKFIFATTEIRKVPVTVLSRCQRFDLRRVDSATLKSHFARVAEAESASIDDDALGMIARAADGSVRDGLSLLDQAIARGQGKVSAADVKEMLGLADRARLIALFEALHTGDMPQALSIAEELNAHGADPLVVLHDLADITHVLARAQAVPELLKDQSLPELERDLAKGTGSKLGVPALTRTWQILLKGMQEVQYASDARRALEMVLIRLAHAASLPTPDDIIRTLKDMPASPSPPPSGNGHDHASNGTAPSATWRSAPTSSGGGGASRLALAVETAEPRAREQVQTDQATAYLPMPQNFAELARLFEEKKEIALYSHLYADVHVISYQPGALEMRVESKAPSNLVGRMVQLLQAWTGERWMVSLSSEPGEPTLSEKNKEEKNARTQRAESHPLVQAALNAFPGAKLTAVRVKTVAEEVAPPLPSKDDGQIEATFSEDE